MVIKPEITLKMYIFVTGDADCSGTANSTDALLILRYSLRLNMGGTSWCE
ncbi:MAG: hypothetical protein ACD_7C00266G0012 [uncultured bacterium]|nr:MAG: hypothetical protein ACD_7C00266G0012 [uncultured bacterium]